MKVILLQEVKGKGIEGDVISVADGFANNYLLPRKMAVLATKGNLKQLDQRRHNIAKREEGRIAAANQMNDSLNGLTVLVNARVGEEGQLFGSVTTQMIADALKEQFEIEIDKKLIDLAAPIKTAGKHQANVSLHRDVKSTLNLLVGDADTLAAIEAEDVAEEIVEDVVETVIEDAVIAEAIEEAEESAE